MPFDDFVRIASAGIVAHNEKPGRRTEMGRGIRSFDEVFAASYAVAPIGKATPEQMRLALLTADDRPTDRRTGQIDLLGNRYWAAELSQIAGERVTVRFDPDDLTKPLHVYTRDGRFLVEAPMIAATGFLDLAAAKERARRESDLKRSVKKLAEAERLLDASQIAALVPLAPDEAELPEPTVIRPVRHMAGGRTATAARPAPQDHGFVDAMMVGAARLRLVD